MKRCNSRNRKPKPYRPPYLNRFKAWMFAKRFGHSIVWGTICQYYFCIRTNCKDTWTEKEMEKVMMEDKQ